MSRRVHAVGLLSALVVAACAGSAPASSGSGPAQAASPSAAPTSRTPAAPTPPPSSTAPSPSVSTAPSVAPVPVWARLDPAGRSPRDREDHTWTVDPAANVAYLFGGRDGSRVFDDLWRYDLRADAWTLVAPPGAAPAARFGHTGTWVPGVGLVVWSGQAGTDFFSDIWAFDPVASTWRRLPAAGATPKARYGSCAALGPDDRLWISHGFTEDAGRFSDTRAYDFTTERWSDETPEGTVPTIRCLHDCLWTPDGRFLIYAGQTTGVPAIRDLWARPLEGGWTKAANVQPAARQLYALAAVDSGEGAGRAFVFGGGSKDGVKLADLWSLDLGSLTWRMEAPAGRKPVGRSGATLIANPERSRLLLFGGRTRGGALGDIWELSLGG